MISQRILVVEQKPSIMKEIRTSLRGHDVFFAETGVAALKEALQTRPAVIIMNVKPPQASGLEICGKLQAATSTRDIPVLFITTAHGQSGTPEAWEDEDHIVEPLGITKLRQRVERILKEHAGARIFRDIFSKTMNGLTSDVPQEFTESDAKELEEGGFPVRAAAEPRPIADRAAAYAALVVSGLSTAQAASRLGVNTSRIRQRLLSQPPTLYGFRKDNEWILPVFQFHKKGLVPNIDKVIARLDTSLDPVAIFRWFTGVNPDLVHEEKPSSPLDWLSQGFTWEAVAELAGDL